MGMGTMVSAAEKESSIPEYSETNDGGMTVNIAGDQEGTIVEGSGNEEGINPLWWPGDGPAPQVTSISLYKYGWLTNGNFGVTIKVYGYGSDTTTFDGRSISWIHQEPFIISGTGADGFYYTYDCGPITQAGSYRFNTTFRSTNFPNTTRSFSTVFTFCNLLEYLTQRDIQTKNSGVNVRYRGKHRFFKGFNEFIKEKTRRCDNDFEKIERHVFF